MKIEKLNRAQAEITYEKWLSSDRPVFDVSNDYEKLRQDLHERYRLAKSKIFSEDNRKEYLIDVYFGIEIYECLSTYSSFNLNALADEDVWRYIAVIVAPDIIYDKWGDNADRYWKRGTRIWFRALWWYIHLSWQGSSDSTLDMLIKPQFNADVVLNLVERIGKYGTYIETIREIMRYYSQIPNYLISGYNRSQEGNMNLFRAIMKMHTAKSLIIDPNLCDGGVPSYVEAIFKETGFDQNKI